MEFKNGMKFLFIGNSATHVNNIPQTLQRYAAKCGFEFEAVINSLYRHIKFNDK